MKTVLLKHFKRKATIGVALRFFVVTSSEPGLIDSARFLRTLSQSVFVVATLACSISAEDDVQRQADDLKKLQLEAGTKIVQEFPRSFHARQVLANVYKTQGDHESFIATLKACSQLAPTRADVFEQLGLEALELGDPAAAVKSLTRSLEIDSIRRVQVELANALIQTGDFDKASRVLNQLSSSPSDESSADGEEVDAKERSVGEAAGTVAYLLGEIAFQKGDFEVASEHYRQAVRQQPHHLNALYGMVKVAMQLDDVETAEKYSAKFEALQARIAELNQARRREYDDLTNLRHHTATTLTDIGRVYQRVHRPSEAVQFWRRASDMDPENATSRKLLASHLVTAKQYSLAAAVYRELVKLEPAEIDHYEKLGIVLASSGDLTAAEKAFEAMVGLPDPSARGCRMLAKFYLNLNKEAEKALRLAKQSVAQEPVADSHFVYGWALARNKQWDAARKQIQLAMELDPSSRTYRRLYQSLPKAR